MSGFLHALFGSNKMDDNNNNNNSTMNSDQETADAVSTVTLTQGSTQEESHQNINDAVTEPTPQDSQDNSGTTPPPAPAQPPILAAPNIQNAASTSPTAPNSHEPDKTDPERKQTSEQLVAETLARMQEPKQPSNPPLPPRSATRLPCCLSDPSTMPSRVFYAVSPSSFLYFMVRPSMCKIRWILPRFSIRLSNEPTPNGVTFNCSPNGFWTLCFSNACLQMLPRICVSPTTIFDQVGDRILFLDKPIQRTE